jgi:hypothetical protein
VFIPTSTSKSEHPEGMFAAFIGTGGPMLTPLGRAWQSAPCVSVSKPWGLALEPSAETRTIAAAYFILDSKRKRAYLFYEKNVAKNWKMCDVC